MSLLLTEKGWVARWPVWKPTAPSSNRGTQSRPVNGSQKNEWRIVCARLLWTRSIALVKPFWTALCVPSRSFTPCYEHLRVQLPIRSITKPLRINALHRRRGRNFATCETQFILFRMFTVCPSFDFVANAYREKPKDKTTKQNKEQKCCSYSWNHWQCFALFSFLIKIGFFSFFLSLFLFFSSFLSVY